MGQGSNVYVTHVRFEKLKLPEIYFRYSINWEHVRELVNSIAKYGLLEPLLVRKLGSDVYEVLDGVHRYYALRILRIGRVKVRVVDYDYITAYRFILSTAEKKNKFSVIDKMYAIINLAKHYKKSVYEIAKELGISTRTVERYLLVWEYSTEEEKELLAQGRISFRKLLRICSMRKRNEKNVIVCGFCMRETKYLRTLRVCDYCYDVLKRVSYLLSQLPDTHTVERRLAMFVSLVSDMVKSGLLEKEYEKFIETVYQVMLLLSSVRGELVNTYT